MTAVQVNGEYQNSSANSLHSARYRMVAGVGRDGDLAKFVEFSQAQLVRGR